MLLHASYNPVCASPCVFHLVCSSCHLACFFWVLCASSGRMPSPLRKLLCPRACPLAHTMHGCCVNPLGCGAPHLASVRLLSYFGARLHRWMHLFCLLCLFKRMCAVPVAACFTWQHCASLCFCPFFLLYSPPLLYAFALLKACLSSCLSACACATSVAACFDWRLAGRSPGHMSSPIFVFMPSPPRRPFSYLSVCAAQTSPTVPLARPLLAICGSSCMSSS